MTEIPDFSDSKKAEAWLETQPHPVRIAIAARSALRVVPALAGLVPSKPSEWTRDDLILTCVRAILVSGARALYTAPETNDQSGRLIAAASFASSAADTAAFFASSAADTAAFFASSAADTAAAAADTAAFSADTAFFSADAAASASASAAARSAAASDAALGVEAFTTPLWPDGAVKEHFAAAWQSWKSELAKNPDWDFWIRWYDGLWSGTPLNWELQTEVALIPDATWDAGLAEVAEAIRVIELNHLITALPVAERAELDVPTGKIKFVPIEMQNPALIGTILGQVADALDDVLARPSNGMLVTSREAVVLRRTIARYGNDPQRIEMDFVSVARSLTRGISTGELAPSEEIEGLLDAVTQGGVGIRANHPEVAANRAQLSQATFADLTDPQKETMEQAAEIVATALTPTNAEDFSSDAKLIYGPPAPHSLGPQDRNPGIATFDEQVRLFSRTAKLVLFFKRNPDVLTKIEKSNVIRTVKIVKDITWALGALTAIAFGVMLAF